MSKKILGTILGVLLIGLAFLPLSIPPIPNIPDVSINLDVNKPTQEILDTTNTVNSLVTNKEDRTKLAVFNYCFSKRVLGYSNIDTQKLNDVYVKAAEYFFQDSMRDKYTNLDTELIKLFNGILGDENHVLSEDEKVSLNNTFSGLAWSLIQ